MTAKLNAKDLQMLRAMGIRDAEPIAPETQFDGTVPFNAQDMLDRLQRLKAEGRMPSLADVLRVVQKASEDCGQ